MEQRDPRTAQKPKNNNIVDSDDEDYSDFKKQNFSPDGDDLIEEEHDILYNQFEENEVEVDDSYLQSQFSYMYSNDEDDLIDANLFGESMKKREKIFNGDDEGAVADLKKSDSAMIQEMPEDQEQDLIGEEKKTPDTSATSHKISDKQKAIT